MSDNITVAVRNLSKSYYLTKTGSERGFSFGRGRRKVPALLPLSFVTHAGEAVGVLGKNGSGKTTLLNLIAGNEEPTTGQVLVKSQPTLLSVGAVLQPHLPGSQNVKLGLLAQGLTPPEVENLEAAVADWAGINDAIDRPLRTYSSGMKARLKFAIATAVPQEILLVDEALATGDASFAARAKERMDSFLDESGTVFIVSHSAATIRKHCNRAIWIHEGEMIGDGPVEEIAEIYNKWSKEAASKEAEAASQIISKAREAFAMPQIIFESEAEKFLD